LPHLKAELQTYFIKTRLSDYKDVIPCPVQPVLYQGQWHCRISYIALRPIPTIRIYSGTIIAGLCRLYLQLPKYAAGWCNHQISHPDSEPGVHSQSVDENDNCPKLLIPAFCVILFLYQLFQ